MSVSTKEYIADFSDKRFYDNIKAEEMSNDHLSVIDPDCFDYSLPECLTDNEYRIERTLQ